MENILSYLTLIVILGFLMWSVFKFGVTEGRHKERMKILDVMQKFEPTKYKEVTVWQYWNFIFIELERVWNLK